MLRVVGGIVVGLLVAFVIFIGFQTMNLSIYPLPEGVTPNDHDAFAEFVSNLPITAFVIVLAGYVAGSLAGGFVGAKFAHSKWKVIGLVIGIVLTAGGAMNVLSIPHPGWFVILNLLLFIPMALLGAMLGRPRQSAAAP